MPRPHKTRFLSVLLLALCFCCLLSSVVLATSQFNDNGTGLA